MGTATSWMLNAFMQFLTRASPLTQWRGTREYVDSSKRRAAPLSLNDEVDPNYWTTGLDREIRFEC